MSDIPPVAESPNAPAPDGVTTGRLLVCERGGHWAGVLRRELAASGVRVWETRTLADCWNELARSPASFLVVELGSDVAGLLRRMIRQGREFPEAHVAIVADRGRTGYAWLMREAGAVYFLTSPRQVGRLAQLACRHLDQVPPPPQSLAERIWASLPWAERRSVENSPS